MMTYEQMTKGMAVATLFTLPISTSTTLVLFLLTTLLIALSGHWKEKMALLKRNPIALYFVGFYVLYLVGATYSIGSAADIKHQLLKFSWLLLTPLWMVLFTEAQWRTRAVNAFLIAMTITLMLTFIKHFQWISNPHFWHALNHRLSEVSNTPFKDYIIQSFLMSLAAMIFLHRSLNQKHWGYGILFLLATIDILFINQGRTGYIIFILLTGYTLFSQRHSKKSIIVLSAGAIALTALLILLPGSMHLRLHGAAQDIQQWKKGQEKTSLGYRMAWQRNAITLIKHRPITGYGTGSIKSAYAMLPKKNTAQTGVVDNTSNEYLNIAIQFGGIGLIVFFALLLMQWHYSFLLPKENGFIMRVLLIALCVGNLANSWLMDFTPGHCYALMTALIFGAFSTRQVPSTATNHVDNDDVATDTSA